MSYRIGSETIINRQSKRPLTQRFLPLTQSPLSCMDKETKIVLSFENGN